MLGGDILWRYINEGVYMREGDDLTYLCLAERRACESTLERPSAERVAAQGRFGSSWTLIGLGSTASPPTLTLALAPV